MEQKFLRIENRVSKPSQLPDITEIRMLGASTAYGSDEKIGQFGSGWKFSLALLAREGLLSDFKFSIDTDVYTAGTKTVGNYEEIYIKKRGGETIPLNMSVGFGQVEWRDVTMAVREYVSNALDASWESFGDYSGATVSVVERCGAKAGTVRMHVPLTPEINEYYLRRKHYFICLKPDYTPDIAVEEVEEYEDNESVLFYRKGVLVGEFMDDGVALFRYNLNSLTVGENRKIDSWDAANAAKYALMNGRPHIVRRMVRAMVDGEDCWETRHVNYASFRHADESQKTVWKKAIQEELNKSVLVLDVNGKVNVEAKGYETHLVKSEVLAALREMGATTYLEVLSKDEAEGRTVRDIPRDAKLHKVFQRIWSKLESANMVNAKPCPQVKAFRSMQTEETSTLGYYLMGEDTIYVHEDHIEDGGAKLKQIIVHELGHYVTQAKDNTTPFENWLMAVAAEFI